MQSETMCNSRNPVIQDLNQAISLIQGHSKIIKALSSDARLKDLPDRLKRADAELSLIRTAIFNAAAEDKRQSVERDMPALVRLCGSRVLKIQLELARMAREFQTQQGRYAEQVKVLGGKGFSAEQIAAIIEPPNEQEHHEMVENLKREQSKLDMFIKDYPRYDQSILAGTQFENWKPEKVVDFDVAAAALAV
ncbi:MAG: hypothetical protein ACXWTS_02555 [Methylococcaceae bacterium]